MEVLRLNNDVFGKASIGQKNKLLTVFMEKRLAADLRKLGITLTGTQITVLAYINANGSVTQKQIELALQLSHPTIRGIVKRLVSAKMIETTIAENDRRQVIIRLSLEGKSFLNEQLDAVQQRVILNESALEKGILQSDLVTFERVLDQMIRNMNQ